LVNIFG